MGCDRHRTEDSQCILHIRAEKAEIEEELRKRGIKVAFSGTLGSGVRVMDTSPVGVELKWEGADTCWWGRRGGARD